MSRAQPASRRAGPIDWSDIHRRLDGLRHQLDVGRVPAPERSRAILRARARELALPLVTANIAAPLEVIVFALGGETCAVETVWVGGVFPLAGLTCLPGTPEFLRGIVHVRGEIVSVVDVGSFFGLPRGEAGRQQRMILLHGRDMAFGMLAERVDGVRVIDRARLQQGLPTFTERRREYVLGIAEGQLAVLDAEAMLGDPRLVVHDEEAGVPCPVRAGMSDAARSDTT